MKWPWREEVPDINEKRGLAIGRLRSLVSRMQKQPGMMLKYDTVKSRLSERRLSETTGLFEDDGQSRLFSLLSIAIKLPIIRISIIRKIQFFEAIRRS